MSTDINLLEQNADALDSAVCLLAAEDLSKVMCIFLKIWVLPKEKVGYGQRIV